MEIETMEIDDEEVKCSSQTSFSIHLKNLDSFNGYSKSVEQEINSTYYPKQQSPLKRKNKVDVDELYFQTKQEEFHELGMDIDENNILNQEFTSVYKKIKRMKIPSDDDETIEFFPLESAEFVIKVQTLSGKVLTLPVHSSATILKIKEKIEESEGIPKEQQRLIFAGKTMANSKQLRDYHIKGSSLLHLVLALRGG